jgi:hypothetical protein
VLREIYGAEGDEVTGECRRIHNEEIHDLYCSSNIMMIKSRIMRWAVHVARMRVRRIEGLVGKRER